jgi:outer membrane biosynthesis protein TonB
VYIRTSQNERSAEAPKNAPFISDRNTTASTIKAPAPDATEPMPSMDGLKLPTKDMADRDHKDGELKDDARPKTPAGKVAMLQPQPPTPPAPPSILKPKDAAPPPQPVVPPTQNVAKAVPESTPLTKMMEEADKALASVDKNRLSIQVKKAEPTPDTTPMPQMKTPQTPPAREIAQTPPETPEQPVPKAIPVMEAEPVTRTTPNQDPNSFTPFTRVQQTKGTISNRGTEDAVDAEGSPKGKYIRSVTSQVEKKWHLYRALRRDMVSPGSLQVEFYVNAKGKVENLRIVNDRESTTLLSEFTVRAIRDAEIPPMPREVMDMLPIMDKQRLKIEYNVLIY